MARPLATVRRDAKSDHSYRIWDHLYIAGRPSDAVFLSGNKVIGGLVVPPRARG